MDYGNEDCCAFCPEVAKLTKERDELLNDMETSACERIMEVQALRRNAETLTKERDELRAEVERLKGCSEAYRKSADTFSELVDFQRGRAEKAEAENERMAGEVVKALNNLLRAGEERDQWEETATNLLTRAEQAESALAAAQPAAKEQFGAGMERAAEIASEFHANENWRKYGGPEEQVAAAIREAAKEGK